MIDKDDSVNYLIEKSIQTTGNHSNSRINYRLKHWDSSIKRYEFLGDYFWIGNLYSRLHELGVADPKSVPIVDLTD